MIVVTRMIFHLQSQNSITIDMPLLAFFGIHLKHLGRILFKSLGYQ